jgi:hypothetical protein
MRKVTYWLPTWRRTDYPIKIIEHPEEGPTCPSFFEAREHTRFCLLADGRILWGDGLYVMHADLTRAATSKFACESLMEGVVMKVPATGKWCVPLIDYHPLVGRQEDHTKTALKLLSQLESWKADTKDITPYLLGDEG